MGEDGNWCEVTGEKDDYIARKACAKRTKVYASVFGTAKAVPLQKRGVQHYVDEAAFYLRIVSLLNFFNALTGTGKEENPIKSGRTRPFAYSVWHRHTSRNFPTTEEQ